MPLVLGEVCLSEAAPAAGMSARLSEPEVTLGQYSTVCGGNSGWQQRHCILEYQASEDRSNFS
jgi:hypothetical protein